MGRSEKIWGPDARSFRPERWLSENGELKRESAGQWPAFHAGPRVCKCIFCEHISHTQKSIIYVQN